jgi:hypothetical protein
MSRKRVNSRALRQLALGFLEEIAQEVSIFEAERDDLATSLVRQWITYDGNASLFLGEQQYFLVLARTPLGRSCVDPQPGLAGWMNVLKEDWKISSDEMPDILGQLNRGQSAEVVNTDGIPLRLWVNPKRRSRGVEPLIKEPLEPGLEPKYHKIAADALSTIFGDDLDSDESEELTCSIVKQWHEHDWNASLFIDHDEQVLLQFREESGGGSKVTVSTRSFDLASILDSMGFSSEVVPEMIARINLSQQIEVQHKDGAPSLLWYDPKAQRLRVEALHPIAAADNGLAASIFCPNCTAVLMPWDEGQEQTCPNCGRLVTHG